MDVSFFMERIEVDLLKEKRLLLEAEARVQEAGARVQEAETHAQVADTLRDQVASFQHMMYVPCCVVCMCVSCALCVCMGGTVVVTAVVVAVFFVCCVLCRVCVSYVYVVVTAEVAVSCILCMCIVSCAVCVLYVCVVVVTVVMLLKRVRYLLHKSLPIQGPFHGNQIGTSTQYHATARDSTTLDSKVWPWLVVCWSAYHLHTSTDTLMTALRLNRTASPRSPITAMFMPVPARSSASASDIVQPSAGIRDGDDGAGSGEYEDAQLVGDAGDGAGGADDLSDV
jgi:hypothetical protein